MQYYLLLGAGFSRNWGGWLASEIFEYLISLPEIRSNAEILERLWMEQTHPTGGGFEGALDFFQREMRASTKSSNHFQTLLNASVKAIRTMDRSLLPNLEGGSFNLAKFKGGGVVDFLSRFDAIFTLNQDTLVEREYVFAEGAALSGGKFSGTYLPGIIMSRNQYVSWEEMPTVDVPDTEMARPKNNEQPLIKLHGSWNWKNSRNSEMVVLGGGKSLAIKESALLSSYHSFFREEITKDAARLMIIGYGFRDNHINEIIEAGCRKGLEMFVIDPSGHNVVLGGKAGPKGEVTPFERSLCGASRRSLREIFGGDLVEGGKIDAFFQS